MNIAIYKFPIYFPIVSAGFCIIGIAVVVYLFRKFGDRYRAVSVVILLISVFAGGMATPTLIMDRIVIDDEQLEYIGGLWWNPSPRGFHLSEISRVTLGTERDRKDRQHFVWVLTMKNGQNRNFPKSDLMAIHRSDIFGRLRQKGIEIQ